MPEGGRCESLRKLQMAVRKVFDDVEDEQGAQIWDRTNALPLIRLTPPATRCKVTSISTFRDIYNSSPFTLTPCPTLSREISFRANPKVDGILNIELPSPVSF